MPRGLATGLFHLGAGGVAQHERKELCTLFEERGPLAPTLCVGWATADLAAHLFVREARPWAVAGITVPQLAAMTERAMESAKRSLGYGGLVARLRSGPPLLGRLVDEQLNTLEFFVHHEDVRRAGADPLPPREDGELDDALFAQLRLAGRLLSRRVRGAGLELVAPGHGRLVAKRGDPSATLSGSPQELVLYLFGRRSAAKVQLDGPARAVEAVAGSPLGA